MNSSLYGKIEKAKRYAQEPERIKFTSLSVDFQGEHDVYQVSYDGASWHCTCHFFSSWGTCTHVMTMQRILGPMLTLEARTSSGTVTEEEPQKASA